MFQRAFEDRPRTVREEVFPAPTRGWVQSGNIVTASPEAAEVLDNFFVTSQGARLRGGTSKFADIGASVVRMFTYSSGGNEDFWGATATGLYDLARVNTATPASGALSDESGNTLTDESGQTLSDESGDGSVTALYADIEGLTSGDWSTTQISTSAGQFLVAVNGADLAMYWGGAEWNPINGAAVTELPFDAETASFTVGDTITGGTSGASATLLAITKTSPTAGVLKMGAITSGPFQDNEAITSAAGAATAAGASASASAITITNVATSALSQVWNFKERLFFVEKDTASVWYLPTEAIGGAAVELNLGAVLAKGGSILFGATWSLDSGSGLDDVCLFFSDQGEIAVYEGTDPSSASTWRLAGVYEIGKPLNKHAFFKAGGDLAVLTEDGIIPVSEALRKDRAALQTQALSFPIEDAWRDAISNRTTTYPITATLWQAQRLLVVGTPARTGGVNVAFAANARTGAWSRITGWDVRCSTIYGDDLYFGDDDGNVFKADTGGTDNGTEYTATYVPKFSYSERLRGALTAGVTYRCTNEVDFDLYSHADYQVDAMDVPWPAETDATSSWGAGVWGTFVWGGADSLNSYTKWQQVRSSGYAIAPALRISSNQTPLLEFEILAMRLRTEQGYPL